MTIKLSDNAEAMLIAYGRVQQIENNGGIAPAAGELLDVYLTADEMMAAMDELIAAGFIAKRKKFNN